MSKAGKNTEKYHKKWYKLDLSANVYPTLQRKDFSSVFRLSVTLTEPVDPVLLEQAFHLTIPRFPTFASAIRAAVGSIRQGRTGRRRPAGSDEDDALFIG